MASIFITLLEEAEKKRKEQYGRHITLRYNCIDTYNSIQARYGYHTISQHTHCASATTISP